MAATKSQAQHSTRRTGNKRRTRTKQLKSNHMTQYHHMIWQYGNSRNDGIGRNETRQRLQQNVNVWSAHTRETARVKSHDSTSSYDLVTRQWPQPELAATKRQTFSHDLAPKNRHKTSFS
jgi:hypothetical protein